MTVSRRSFLRSAGAGGVGALGLTFVSARGSEAAREEGTGPPAGSSRGFAADERAALRLLVKEPIRCDSNENPNGPGKRVLNAVRAMFGEAPRYPDLTTAAVQRAIAAHHGLPAERVLVGCGSGELLRMAAFAFTSAERPLVTATPSFEDPVRHAEAAGAPVRAVPVDAALRLDLDGMLARTPGAGLVFLCNPNNPTGTVHGAAPVREFVARAARAQPDCVVLVDEAYHEYVDDPGYASMLAEAAETSTVLVVRTFSKVYGMAGLRIGYAVGHPDVLRRMARHRLPNSVNVLAAAAAIAALRDSRHPERERRLNRAAREYTRDALAKLGFPAPESHANFIMVPIRRDARDFREACAKRGVLVGRPFPPLTTHARISIGTMAEMRRAVEVFREVFTTSAS